MLEAGVDGWIRALVSLGANHGDRIVGRRDTTGPLFRWIPRREHFAVGIQRRSSGQEELVCRKTGPLVSLEIPVGPPVLLRNVKIRLDQAGGVVHVPVLRKGRDNASLLWHRGVLVGPVHLALVIGCDEGKVAVIEIEAGFKRDWEQRNHLALGIESGRGNVHSRFKVRIAAKQVVWRPVFLEDHDDMFEFDGLRS